MFDNKHHKIQQEVDLQYRFEIYLSCVVVDLINKKNIDTHIKDVQIPTAINTFYLNRIETTI